MHIVDITMFFARESGGVKRYLLEKQQWLRTQTSARHTLLVPGAATTREQDGIAYVKSPPLPFSGGYRFPLRQNPWKRQLLDLAPDLIEAGDPYVVPWAAADAARELGVPAVAFHHSDVTRLLSSRLGGWSAGPINRYLRALYERFDLVIAPSRIMASKLEAIGVTHTALQPLGVDTQLFHPSRHDPGLRGELGLSADTRLLVFAGRFSHEKNIPALIGAFRRLGRGYHLLLIGGSRRGRPAPNVTLLPYQGRGTDLARYIASADAMVHAGDSETFGLVVAEAMACGRPVVGVDSGAVPELVDAAVGVLVPRARSRQLAEGVQALYESDLTAMGARARQRVEAHYSWDQVLRNLLVLYARLTGVAVPATGDARHAVR
jgi:alpha-1,6-mannosyltransferase